MSWDRASFIIQANLSKLPCVEKVSTVALSSILENTEMKSPLITKEELPTSGIGKSAWPSDEQLATWKKEEEELTS